MTDFLIFTLFFGEKNLSRNKRDIFLEKQVIHPIGQTNDFM